MLRGYPDLGLLGTATGGHRKLGVTDRQIRNLDPFGVSITDEQQAIDGKGNIGSVVEQHRYHATISARFVRIPDTHIMRTASYASQQRY